MDQTTTDENQVNEAFIDEGRGHLPSHLKFFLLVFSKIKRRHSIKMRPKPKAQEGQSPKSPSPSHEGQGQVLNNKEFCLERCLEGSIRNLFC